MVAETPVVLVRVDREPARHTRHPRHRHAPLDLLYVQAGLAARGIDAPLVDHWRDPSPLGPLLARVAARHPRAVLLRANGWAADETLRLGRALRAHGIVTVVAGQLVTQARMRPLAGWADAFDLTVAGEPEQAAVDLLGQLLAGANPADLAGDEALRLAAQGPHLVRDPDALPAPAQSRRQMAAYRFPFPLRGRPAKRWGHVQSSWGCPSRCLHCTEVVRKSVGFHYRRRDPAAVAAEVARLAAAGADAICFEDDSLLADRRHFLALCVELERLRPRVRWLASVRPDDLDEETVAAAARAGAALFKVGVETGAPRLAELIGKARDGHAWRARVVAVFGLLERAGIGSVALFLVGLPGETAAERTLSLDLARRLRPDYLQLQRFTAYPDVGLAAGTGADPGYHYPLPGHAPDPLDAAQAAFYRRFYLRPGFVGRHLAHAWRSYLDPARLAAAGGQVVAAANVMLGPLLARTDRAAPK